MPTCPWRLLSGTPRPGSQTLPGAQAAAGIHGPARSGLGPAAPPAAASAPVANLRAWPRSCPPAPGAGEAPSRCQAASRRSAGREGGPW